METIVVKHSPPVSGFFGFLSFVMLSLQVESPALAATFRVGVGDDCAPGVAVCFFPTPLTINVGDSVNFYDYADTLFTGPHNVAADDGSFRCANGCDDEGGNGAPAGDNTCGSTFIGICYACCEWNALRTFSRPGIVSYHDEVSNARGVIIVQSAGGSMPAFSIGPGITGAWYDPTQDGHGLLIEVLSDSRFFASWFAFTPAGTQQAWFSGVGTYSGNVASVASVQQPTGGRWIPNFDSSQVIRNEWGTLSFAFTDCDHGRVDFNSIAGYGSGTLNLTRLTRPAGLTCP